MFKKRRIIFLRIGSRLRILSDPYHCNSNTFTDLKAFERRLTEVIACLQPATTRWRSEYICNAV